MRTTDFCQVLLFYGASFAAAKRGSSRWQTLRCAQLRLSSGVMSLTAPRKKTSDRFESPGSCWFNMVSRNGICWLGLGSITERNVKARLQLVTKRQKQGILHKFMISERVQSLALFMF